MEKRLKRQHQHLMFSHQRMILWVCHAHPLNGVQEKDVLIVHVISILEEIISIPNDHRCCPECGEDYVSFPKTEDSDIIEIHVAVHVRHIKREQAKAGCNCPNRSGLITAPTAPRVYPKARYGVSIWVLVLLSLFGWVKTPSFSWLL